MLIEIKCDAFKTGSQEIRPTIQFHKGLNVVLGGDQADNSIGKSTFLLIIDFVFGGKQYPKSESAQEIGDHTIFFSFQFGKEILSFGRNTIATSKVIVCNRDYEKIGEMKLNNFTALLNEKYGLPQNSISFRSMVGRFSRVYGKENCHVKKPLQYAGKEKDQNGIFALENLFEEYDTVAKHVEEVKLNQDKLKFFNKASKNEQIYSLTSKGAYDHAVFKKDELMKTKKSLESKMDITAAKLKTENARKAGDLRYNIEQYRRTISQIQTRLKVLDQNINGEFLEAQRNIAKLKTFFPTIQLETLDRVENFHQKIRRIFKHELIADSDVLKLQMLEINHRINDLELRIRKLREPLALNPEEFEEYDKLITQICILDLQIKRYEEKLNLQKELTIARDNYASIQEKTLFLIQSEINNQTTNYTNLISKDAAYPPLIQFKPPKNYTYSSSKDEGTGTAYREIITFDLSILKLTNLPILIHDSFMFKNIEDEYVEQILNIYNQSAKQIFIAFDGATKYSKHVQSILKKSTVLKVSTGNELFGKSWARKS